MNNIEETFDETSPVVVNKQESQNEHFQEVLNLDHDDDALSDIPEDAILNSKMASGVGHRNKSEPDHEADANRVTVAMDTVGRWLGFNASDNQEGLIEVASIGKDKVLVRPSSITVRKQTGAVTVYSEGERPSKQKLDRGGWTAIGLLLVFLPVVIGLGLLAFNLEQSLEAQQLKNFHFQRQEDSTLQTKLAEAVNNPATFVIRMKSLEGIPQPGAITLFQPPGANWLLTFSNVPKLEQGQILVAWFVKKHESIPTKDPNNYMYIADFNGNITRSGVSEVSISGLYSGKDQKAQDYTEMIVTIESANQKEYKQPSAPIYFLGTLPQNHF